MNRPLILLKTLRELSADDGEPTHNFGALESAFYTVLTQYENPPFPNWDPPTDMSTVQDDELSQALHTASLMKAHYGRLYEKLTGVVKALSRKVTQGVSYLMLHDNAGYKKDAQLRSQNDSRILLLDDILSSFEILKAACKGEEDYWAPVMASLSRNIELRKKQITVPQAVKMPITPLRRGKS